MQNTNERIEMVCPLNGKMCINGRREDFPKDKMGSLIQCRLWVHLYGKDPQSEKIVDQWDCSMAWMPTCQVETSQMERQTSHELSKLSNIMDSAKTSMNRMIQSMAIMIEKNQWKQLPSIPKTIHQISDNGGSESEENNGNK